MRNNKGRMAGKNNCRERAHIQKRFGLNFGDRTRSPSYSLALHLSLVEVLYSPCARGMKSAIDINNKQEDNAMVARLPRGIEGKGVIMRVVQNKMEIVGLRGLCVKQRKV
jgi:hypothetical protein